MASFKKKFIMMGISTILIPLGKLILKKIVSRTIDKLEDKPPAKEKS